MTDLTMYCFMALTVFFIIAAIVLVAGSHKSYIATPKDISKREATKPVRSKRAQEIWNRLNPRMYLDDDETEPLPQKQARNKAKQS